MPSTLKYMLFIVLLISLIGCNVEKNSPLGGDVIDAPDAGIFKQIKIPSEASEYTNTFDTLSGRHRYIDSLGRLGKRQGELIAGTWHDEKSMVYLTSYTSGNDVDSNKVPFEQTYKGVLTAAFNTHPDTVRTTLVMSINSKKSSVGGSSATPSLYTLNVYSGEYVADSTLYNPDSLSRTLLHNGIVSGANATYAIPLQGFNITFEPGDTVVMQTNNITTISPRQITITSDTIRWISDTKRDTTKTDTTHSTDTLHTALIQDTILDWMSVIEGLTLDSTYLDTTDTLENSDTSLYYYQKLLTYRYDTIQVAVGDKKLKVDTLLDSAIHTRRIQRDLSLQDTALAVFDTLWYTMDSSISAKTIAFDSSTTVPGKVDSLRADTTVSNSTAAQNILMQKWYIYRKEVRRYTFDPIQELLDSMSDTLNLYLDIATSGDSLLHFSKPAIRVTAHNYDTSVTTNPVDTTLRDTTITSKTDTTWCYFNRATMTVTTDQTYDKSLPFLDGGLERFSVTKLNLDTLWRIVQDSGYKFVSHAELKLPLDIGNTLFPPYADSIMKLRGIIFTSDTLTPAMVLQTTGEGEESRYQFETTINKNDSLISFDLTDNLHDILREHKIFFDTSTVPETYLYLWLDGSDMGRIYWKPSDSLDFNFILQQAN